MTRRGVFITFEGGEGVGKSTQSAMLADALRARGHRVERTREPGGTAGAEAVRTLLLDRADCQWNAPSEALLFAAARSDHVGTLIEPALARGSWVICDRFIDSTRAYQGGGGGLDDARIMDLHTFGSNGLLPDITLLLEVPAEIALQRIALRDGGSSDRIAGKGAAYHALVAARFRQIAEEEPERFAVIDASADAHEVHSRILAAMDARLA
jgi:dTMP kinase